MNINLSHRACYNFILLIFFLLIINNSHAQPGLQLPVFNFDSYSDSTSVHFPKPLLPLRNWFDQTDHFFGLKHETNELDINHYISPSNIIPKDPFKLDVRGSSYYVPRMVRDELNLIMNRPRDNAFVPILPAAFLALQLASKYILIQMKTEISWKDVENCREGRPILEELWKKNPQTISELYKRENLKDNYTMMELQRLTEGLSDNKLVKRKLIENSETQYFFALEKIQYLHLVEKGKAEKLNSQLPSNTSVLEISPQIK
jgi:hypothetical protein